MMNAVDTAEVHDLMDPSYCRSLIEYARDIILIITLAGKIIDANRAATEAYGYSAAELRSMNIRGLRPPETHNEIQTQINTAHREGILFKTYHLRRTGEKFPVEISSRKIEIQGGQFIISIIRDISATAAVEKALRESEEKFRLLMGNLYTGVYIIEGANFSYVNFAMQNITGYSEEELLELNYWEIVDPSQQQEVRERAVKHREGVHVPNTYTLHLRRKDGESRWCDMVSEGRLIDGQYAVIGLLHDITDRINAEEALAESEKRYRLLAENVGDVIWTTDKDGVFTYLSPSVKTQLAFAPEELIGRDLLSLIPPDSKAAVAEEIRKLINNLCGNNGGRSFFEFQMTKKDGSLLWVEISATVFQAENGGKYGILGISRDVSERKNLQEKLFRLATTDQMTGTLNSSHFMEYGNREMERSERLGRKIALFFIDLDCFKRINDTYGHESGDRVLNAFARLAKENIREYDVLGRIGGDEFAVVLPETDAQEAIAVAERLRKAVEAAEMLPGTNIYLTVSIGVAVRKDRNITFAELLRSADNALYVAKKDGRNCVRLDI